MKKNLLKIILPSYYDILFTFTQHSKSEPAIILEYAGEREK